MKKKFRLKIKTDQIYMAVLFWYLVKVALVYATVQKDKSRHILQGTRNTQLCITSDPVVITANIYNNKTSSCIDSCIDYAICIGLYFD